VSDTTALDRLCVDTIRFLAVDAVQRADSGHPGAPLGLAAAAYALWDRFLIHNPSNPGWPDRDRFVLSAGHASALLYALLHLTGYAVTLDDLRRFRQWGSRTPGHPERGLTPGVETTTGPLGQGFANAVGLAIAERRLAAEFNRPGQEIVGHRTYVIASDGDLMEGVSSEAASLAGTLRLGKLVCLYDDNGVSIEGATDLAFREDVASRFAAYGWHVAGPVDGLDVGAVARGIEQANDEGDRPSLVVCRTAIGYGSPGEGTAAVHGSPLGRDGVAATKRTLGWPDSPAFHVPDEALEHMRKAVVRGERAEMEWERRLNDYGRDHPDAAESFETRMRGGLPEGWFDAAEGLFRDGQDALATRSASGEVLNAIAPAVPALFGGSADLAPSTKTSIADAGSFSADEPEGRNIHFGVREHAMGSIANGLALHGGFIPYTGTFLVFSDYMRPPMRLAAMMGLRVVHVFTHDSIGLGEDGPTHQPVEHLASLRAVPNLLVIRPADAAETAFAWRAALEAEGPTALALTRQKVPVLDRGALAPADGAMKGGYVLWESGSGTPEIILIGTGSEVHIALEAGRALAEEGVAARVVSLPCWKLFDRQRRAWREDVLPAAVRARISVEAGVTTGWRRYVGLDGVSVGLDRFGASAPFGENYRRLGITAEAVASRARELLER